MNLKHYLLIGVFAIFANAAPAATVPADDVCSRGPYVDLLLKITRKAESSTRAADKAAYAALLNQLKDYPSKCVKYAKAHGGQ